MPKDRESQHEKAKNFNKYRKNHRNYRISVHNRIFGLDVWTGKVR